jgi:hypothetical protein
VPILRRLVAFQRLVSMFLSAWYVKYTEFIPSLKLIIDDFTDNFKYGGCTQRDWNWILNTARL